MQYNRPEMERLQNSDYDYSPTETVYYNNKYSVITMGGITNFDTRQMALPPQELSCGCVAVGGIDNFGGHKFPSEATAKNAWIK